MVEVFLFLDHYIFYGVDKKKYVTNIIKINI